MITQQDLINLRIAGQSNVTDEFILKDLIEHHDTRHMKTGVKYYLNENDILGRQIFYYDQSGQKVIDKDHINNRVPHNWHKLLVDQKTSYLLGRPAVLTAQEEAFTAVINEYLDEQWDDTLQELGKNSSNKGVEYLHPYVDSKGEFDYIILPAEQIIAIYDSDYEKVIEEFIRYYPVMVNGHERIKAEWWKADDVTYYIQNENGVFELDPEEEENPSGHFLYKDQPMGWGKAPIVAFKNNEEMVSDLKFYKEMVDLMDLIISDGGNDLTSIQKLIYVLKGYMGTSGEEFMTNIRKFKFIGVDDQGGVDTLRADIPVDAVKEYLDRLEENIFLFGQGVNIKTDRFGNSPSGIALKFLYSLLELKANTMARKFAKSIKEFIWFLATYLEISGQGKYNPDRMKVTFSRSMLINDKEQVDMARDSRGVISDKTIRSNHPWVDDAAAEKTQMEEEAAERIDLDSVIEQLKALEQNAGEGEDD